MIKILHSADWHLDSPLLFRDPAQSLVLRNALLSIPGQVAALCRKEQCDLLLLSGDLFDGSYSADTLRIVKNALEEASVPVFITPGNHDFVGPDSPWLSTSWPENVHIFTHPAIESVPVPSLDCRIYGAGYIQMDCPPLLADFTANHPEQHKIGILHADPTQVRSPYCPITSQQIADSGLQYLALGHIHKGGQLTAGKTLCAWPGCPVGRGYDELEEKGVLLVTVDQDITTQFIPLSGPRFYDYEIRLESELEEKLPPVGNEDFYRITFTGARNAPDLTALRQAYPQFPYLELRDKTTPPVDIWSSAGEDTFEGMYFGRLQEAFTAAEGENKKHIRLAAEISRALLDGQEVVLP